MLYAKCILFVLVIVGLLSVLFGRRSFAGAASQFRCLILDIDTNGYHEKKSTESIKYSQEIKIVCICVFFVKNNYYLRIKMPTKFIEYDLEEQIFVK